MLSACIVIIFWLCGTDLWVIYREITLPLSSEEVLISSDVVMIIGVVRGTTRIHLRSFVISDLHQLCA